MTDDGRFASNLFQMLNVAILRRTAPGKYAVIGQVPDFYNVLFPPVAGGPCAAPWEISSMLEFFLGEAEDFFALHETGTINSGIWREDGLTGENTALAAAAVNMGDMQAIIIRLLEQDYTDRLGILHKAREQLLENRQLANNLSLFREKSRIDGLTSIFNRTTFMELLLDEIKRSQIMGYPLVLLILDIDNFKKVNDTYGHQVGDKILQGMGKTLRNSLRRNDIVARYGGEEFAALIPHAPLGEATQIAEKIRANLAAMSVPDAPRITVSLGCTAYSQDESPENFFKRADDALYAAKKSGKNRVCVK